MRIVVVHNEYQQAGGEDTVVAQEVALLRANGHSVVTAFFSNNDINTLAARIAATLSVVRSPRAIDRLRNLITREKPDVIHFHNFFPLVTPGSLAACADAGVPVVQTLHNYRVICPGGTLMRAGKLCDDCVGNSRWRSVTRRCYRHSIAGSAATAAMGLAFRRIVTARPKLITLVALTHFAKEQFIADGIPEGQIVVRPNFAADTGAGMDFRPPRLLFVGRLSEEKGAQTIIRAAAGINAAVEVVGDGPCGDELRANAPSNVSFLGRLPHAQAVAKMREARALLIPSQSCEGFPMAIAEAMGSGTPIIAANVGSLAELVTHGRTGLLVPVCAGDGWVAAMRRAIENGSEFAEFGRNARRDFESYYSATAGYRSLMKIYENAIDGYRRF